MKEFYWVTVTHGYLACAENETEATYEYHEAIDDATEPDEIVAYKLDPLAPAQTTHGWQCCVPYGQPYFEDDPELTWSEIRARMQEEEVERKKQEELDKLQLKLFE